MSGYDRDATRFLHVARASRRRLWFSAFLPGWLFILHDLAKWDRPFKDHPSLLPTFTSGDVHNPICRPFSPGPNMHTAILGTPKNCSQYWVGTSRVFNIMNLNSGDDCVTMTLAAISPVLATFSVWHPFRDDWWNSAYPQSLTWTQGNRGFPGGNTKVGSLVHDK